MENSKFTDINSNYSYNYAAYGGAIFCAVCGNVEFSGTRFIQNQAINGAAVALYYSNALMNSVAHPMNLIIQDAYFSKNLAQLSGGCVYTTEYINLIDPATLK